MKQDDYKLYNKTILKMKTKILSIILSVFGFALHTSANEKIYVNREVTTHIVMPSSMFWSIESPRCPAIIPTKNTKAMPREIPLT